MTIIFTLSLPVLVCALASPTAVRASTSELPDKVTFSEHIAPIVFNKCTACHRPGEAAPFKLMSYRDVQKRGRTIINVVERRYMPPWQPEPGHGEFQNERRLSDPQIELFRRWVDTGMAEGDPGKLPAMPAFPDGWYHGQPDLVVSVDQAFDVPADGPDIYRNFVLPLNLPEDKWVTAIELRPSVRQVVHHALFFSDSQCSAREAARKHAASFGYRCPVLLDQGHRLASATGATITPEAAVVTADGQIAYRGRIDDLYPQVGIKRQKPT